MQKTYESSNFDEVSGIHIPRDCQLTYEFPPHYYVQFHLEKIEQINEPIPEEAFVITFRNDTRIQDRRDPAKPLLFRVGSTQPVPSDVTDVIAVPEGETGYGRAVLAGISIGLLALPIPIVLWRKRSKGL